MSSAHCNLVNADTPNIPLHRTEKPWTHFMASIGAAYKSKALCCDMLISIADESCFAAYVQENNCKIAQALGQSREVIADLASGKCALSRGTKGVFKIKYTDTDRTILIKSKFEVVPNDFQQVLQLHFPAIYETELLLRLVQAVGTWAVGSFVPEVGALAHCVEQYGMDGAGHCAVDGSLYHKEHAVALHIDDNRLIEPSIPFTHQYYSVTKAWPPAMNIHVLCNNGTKHGCMVPPVQLPTPGDCVLHHKELKFGDVYGMQWAAINGGPAHQIHGDEAMDFNSTRSTKMAKFNDLSLTFVHRMRKSFKDV